MTKDIAIQASQILKRREELVYDLSKIDELIGFTISGTFSRCFGFLKDRKSFNLSKESSIIVSEIFRERVSNELDELDIQLKELNC